MATKQELEQEIERLKKLIHELELEYESACVHDDMVKARRILRERAYADDLLDRMLQHLKDSNNDASS